MFNYHLWAKLIKLRWFLLSKLFSSLLSLLQSQVLNLLLPLFYLCNNLCILIILIIIIINLCAVNISWGPKVMALRDLPIDVAEMKVKLLLPFGNDLTCYRTCNSNRDCNDGILCITCSRRISPYEPHIRWQCSFLWSSGLLLMKVILVIRLGTVNSVFVIVLIIGWVCKKSSLFFYGCEFVISTQCLYTYVGPS